MSVLELGGEGAALALRHAPPGKGRVPTGSLLSALAEFTSHGIGGVRSLVPKAAALDRGLMLTSTSGLAVKKLRREGFYSLPSVPAKRDRSLAFKDQILGTRHFFGVDWTKARLMHKPSSSFLCLCLNSGGVCHIGHVKRALGQTPGLRRTSNISSAFANMPTDMAASNPTLHVSAQARFSDRQQSW